VTLVDNRKRKWNYPIPIYRDWEQSRKAEGNETQTS